MQMQWKKGRGKLGPMGRTFTPLLCASRPRWIAGLARQVFWPDEGEGLRWAVESRNRKGWNRFTEHHYRLA